MNEIQPLIGAGVSGVLLGIIFFGGLWWTVRKGVASSCPAVWFTGSMLLRTGVVLAGFYFISNHHWERLVLALVGFVSSRAAVTRYTRPAREATNAP
jgi:F1F0 ATPase subunit 2